MLTILNEPVEFTGQQNAPKKVIFDDTKKGGKNWHF